MLCLSPQYMHAMQIRNSKILAGEALGQWNHCSVEAEKTWVPDAKKECKEIFLQRGSISMKTLNFMILNTNCPYIVYCFRKIVLKFSLPKHYKSSYENMQTARKFHLLSEISGRLSLQPPACWANSYLTFNLIHTKNILFILLPELFKESFLVPCLFSIIHPSMYPFIYSVNIYWTTQGTTKCSWG